jgi:transposase
MLSAEQIDTIHRLHWGEKWSLRKMARHLHLARKTIRKYLNSPVAPAPVRRRRATKLDPFKTTIAELLAQDATASSVVIAQRLQPLGFHGGITTLRNYVKTIRPTAPPRAFVRMEPPPGERFEIDWGHFGALDYQGDSRKLYAFALVECHSRKQYLEFTHSQSFETFLRCHIHAFEAMGGVARELWFDNLATVVAEHDGKLIRFHPRFLAFAREFDFYPRACNVAAGWEKGKVERAGIGYVRQNFWPLRAFTDLTDVNRQARQWLVEVANQRLHRETRERPDERFRPDCLRPLPAIIPDYRDTVEALVRKDLRLQFDGNRYCVPQRYVGRQLTIKADSSAVSIYDRVHEIVSYPRSWRRGQTFGADRFEPEIAEQRPAARRSQAQQRLIALLGNEGENYLRHLADTERSLTRQIVELLELVRQYGPEVVAAAIAKAQAAGAFGADYIANILKQQQARRDPQPRLQLKDPRLNELATDPLSLLDYDSFILDPEKKKS